MGYISVSVVMLAVAGLLMVLNCNVMASLALQISTAFCSTIFPSLSNLPRVLSHVIPHNYYSISDETVTRLQICIVLILDQ